MNYSVVDYFKAPGETRAKAPGAAEYYNNRNVYSKNYVKNTYINNTNIFSELLSDDDISSVRLIDVNDNSVHGFDKSSSNMLQYFYFKNNKIDYKEISRIEERSSEGYSVLVSYGYNNFYNLYKINEFGNEQLLCIIVFAK